MHLERCISIFIHLKILNSSQGFDTVMKTAGAIYIYITNRSLVFFTLKPVLYADKQPTYNNNGTQLCSKIRQLFPHLHRHSYL